MKARDLERYRQPPSFEFPPKRIISLVPSMTESLIVLGMGDALVGITDYCEEPKGMVEGYQRVGGIKNVRLGDVLALKPDLVIANQEENTPQAVEALLQAGLPVWLTFPKTVREAMEDLWTLVRLFARDQGFQMLRTLERALEVAELAGSERAKVRYFCPIWEEEHPRYGRWWMTFNKHTYMNDLLRIFGGENVFEARERRYPLEAELGETLSEPAAGRDVRYPRVSREEVLRADPELILLPDEPFPYKDEDCQRIARIFAETTAAREGRIYCIDGKLITWHGVRLGKALAELPTFFE